MKFFFSISVIVFLYLFPIQAKEVILFTYHPSQAELTDSIKKIMHSNMDFPEVMVDFIESETPCERREVSAAHICIKEDGEMDFPIIYTETMRESLGVFWKDIKDVKKNI